MKTNETVFSGQATKSSRFTLVIDGDCGEREMRNTITLLIAHADVMRDDGVNGAAEYESWFAEAKAEATTEYTDAARRGTELPKGATP